MLRAERLQIIMDVLPLLCFVVVSGSKVPLACVWHEERLYTAGPVLRNGTGDLADGKPWISMLLSWIGSTIPTRLAFLAFGLSTNIPLTLLISWLLALYA